MGVVHDTLTIERDQQKGARHQHRHCIIETTCDGVGGGGPLGAVSEIFLDSKRTLHSVSSSIGQQTESKSEWVVEAATP